VNSLSFSLQLGTLLPVLFGVTLVRVLAMAHYASQRRVYPGFLPLLFAGGLVLVGMAVLMLRAWAGGSPLLAFVSSAVLLAHPVLMYHGLGLYGRMPHLRTYTMQNAVLVTLVCLALAADAVFDSGMERRVLIFSACGLLLALRIGVELPLRCRRRLPGMNILCLSYLLTAWGQVLRALNTLDIPGYASLSMSQGAIISVYSVCLRTLQSVLELYVVLAMNSAMLEDELKLATAQIERMAHTDALTGLLNRRGLDLSGPEALRRGCAAHAPTAVLMLDLDHFKRVNDTLGHAAGDELLRGVAKLWTGQLRHEDVFARYGGEEFVVVAPTTTQREALALAERMRQTAARADFPALGGMRITVSVGVAIGGGRKGSPCQSLEALIQSADAALYEAKQTGRDKVCVAEVGGDELKGARES